MAGRDWPVNAEAAERAGPIPGTQRFPAEIGRHAKEAGRDRPANTKAVVWGHAAHAKAAGGVRPATQPVEMGFDYWPGGRTTSRGRAWALPRRASAPRGAPPSGSCTISSLSTTRYSLNDVSLEIHNIHAPRREKSRPCPATRNYIIFFCVSIEIIVFEQWHEYLTKQLWSSGRILARHAGDPSSILGSCTQLVFWCLGCGVLVFGV